MKRLTLVRHAKSSWKDASLDDFDRGLNKRGKRNAPMMGRRLAERDLDPDVVITSPAKRARKTARMIADEIDYPLESIREDEDIYEASERTLLDLVRGLDDSLDHVMLVGHNPGFTDLANFLGQQRFENIPTCGVICLDFQIDSWDTVAEGSGAVVFYDYPKNPHP